MLFQCTFTTIMFKICLNLTELYCVLIYLCNVCTCAFTYSTASKPSRLHNHMCQMPITNVCVYHICVCSDSHNYHVQIMCAYAFLMPMLCDTIVCNCPLCYSTALYPHVPSACCKRLCLPNMRALKLICSTIMFKICLRMLIMHVMCVSNMCTCTLSYSTASKPNRMCVCAHLICFTTTMFRFCLYKYVHFIVFYLIKAKPRSHPYVCMLNSYASQLPCLKCAYCVLLYIYACLNLLSEMFQHQYVCVCDAIINSHDQGQI